MAQRDVDVRINNVPDEGASEYLVSITDDGMSVRRVGTSDTGTAFLKPMQKVDDSLFLKPMQKVNDSPLPKPSGLVGPSNESETKGMTDTVKLLVVHSDAALPDGVEVAVSDFRDAILNHPEAFINALKGAMQSTGGGGAGSFTGGQLPPDTPIFKMLPGDVATLLSPAAKRLTKADLLALTTKLKTGADLALTVADMQTIQDAFHLSITNKARGLQSAQASEGVSCCCCTPCCCCTAATVINPRRAA